MCIVVKSKSDKLVEENTHLQSKCLDLEAKLQNVSTLLDQEKSITDGLRLQLVDARKLVRELQAKLGESQTECGSLQTKMDALILEDGETKECLAAVLAENKYLLSGLTKTQLQLQQEITAITATEVVLSGVIKELRGE